MNLDKLLSKFKKGELSKDELKKEINLAEISELGEFAKVDKDRDRRVGAPEAILGQGKNPKEFASIMEEMAREKEVSIGTRVSEDQFSELKSQENEFDLLWFDRAKIAVLKKEEFHFNEDLGKVGVLSAGTADIEAAEEARVIAELLGAETYKAYDVGVAGIHRLFPELKEQLESGVEILIVAAGMDGSLPPVVAGMVEIPVIGLPTSNGYGFGGEGKAALLSMLQSCSILSVVNIDAGFSAGALAAKILKIKE